MQKTKGGEKTILDNYEENCAWPKRFTIWSRTFDGSPKFIKIFS